MDNEQWVAIGGFEGRYEVSNHGGVRSLDRIVARATSNFRRSGVLLIPQLDGDGYLHVSLGRGNLKKIHKLVARAFLPNPDDLPEVDHEDTDKSNCRASNLRWCTKRQNSVYRHTDGSKACTVKVSPELVARITADVAAGKPIQHVARETGVSRAHVRRLALPPVAKDCKHCGVPFTRAAPNRQTFCSRGCHTRNRHGHPPTNPTPPEDQLW